MAGPNRMQDGSVVFDVVKVNMFGTHQPRKLRILVQSDASGDDRGDGTLWILTTGMGVRRNLPASRLQALVEILHLQARENARGLQLQFGEMGLTATRTLLFSSSTERDEFVALFSRLVGAKAIARPLLKLGSALGGAGPASASKSLASADSHAKSVQGHSGNHLVAIENLYGFQCNRVTQLDTSSCMLRILEQPAMDSTKASVLQAHSLSRLERFDVHSVDPCALGLCFQGDRAASSAPAQLVISFRSRDERDDFVEALKPVVDRSGATGEDGGPLLPNYTWRVPLPVRKWFRFLVHRKAGGSMGSGKEFILMCSVRHRTLNFIDSAELAALGGVEAHFIPDTVKIAQTISTLPGAMQVELDPANPRRIRFSTDTPGTPVGDRRYIDIELPTAGERQRLSAVLNSIAAAPTASKDNQPSSAARLAARDPAPPVVPALWHADWPHDEVGVYVGTYNVSGQPPPGPRELQKWIPFPFNKAHDLYVLGFQEIGSAANREKWGKALFEFLNTNPRSAGLDPMQTERNRSATVAASAHPLYGDLSGGGSSGAGAAEQSESAPEPIHTGGYLQVAHAFMWEISLWVFVRAPHAGDISNVQTHYEPTGLALLKNVTGQQLGNKGGLGCSLTWRSTPLAFVNCHLAARPERIPERESDFRQIVRNLQLNSSMQGYGLDFIHGHEHVFFFGDMNYRVDLPFATAVDCHKRGDYPMLASNDQLAKQKQLRRVLDGFEEGQLDFPPTYRWQRQSDEFSNKRAQAPSYTDRITHKSAPGVAWCIDRESYRSAHQLYGSDHRAVSAEYQVQLRQYYTIPAPPPVHSLIPRPSFFAQFDHNVCPPPVILLQDLRVVGYQAAMAPHAMFLSVLSPVLEDNPYVTPAIAAEGISDFQRKQLNDLLDTMRKEAKARKAALKAAAKKSKKEAKKAGKQPTPSLDSSADPAGASVGGSGTDIRRSQSSRLASMQSHPLMVTSMDSARDSPLDEHDSDDEVLLEDAEGGAGARKVDIDTSSLSLAWLTEQSAGASDGGGIDPHRQGLLALSCEYPITPYETALPPMRLHLWDPRILRSMHLNVVAQQPPKSDLGDAKSRVVGQATLPLAPLCDAAADAALEGLQRSMEEEDEEGVELSPAEAAGANPAAALQKMQRSPRARSKGSRARRRSERHLNTYKRQFDKHGIPWAFQHEALPFCVDLFLEGQPVAKLHGKYCMRAATDEEVAGRPGAALIASHWNFDDSIDALRQAVDGVDGGEPSKAGKAVGAGGEEDFDAWESKGSDVEMEDFEADAAGLRYRHRPDHPAYAGSDDRELGGRPSSDLEGGIPSPLRENGEERAAWAAGMRKSESGEYEVSEDSVLEIIAKKADEEVQVQGGGDLTGGASSSDGPPIGSQVGVQERLAARRRSSAPPGSVVEQFANRHMAQAGEAIAEADQETDSEDEEGGREGGGSAGTQAAPAPTRKPAPSPPPPPKRQPVLPPPPASPPAAIAQQAKRNRRRRSTINLLQTSMLPHEMLPGPPSEPPPSGGPTLPPPPVPQLAIGSEAKPGASASSSVRADTTPAAGQSQGTVPPPPPAGASQQQTSSPALVQAGGTAGSASDAAAAAVPVMPAARAPRSALPSLASLRKQTQAAAAAEATQQSRRVSAFAVSAIKIVQPQKPKLGAAASLAPAGNGWGGSTSSGGSTLTHLNGAAGMLRNQGRVTGALRANAGQSRPPPPPPPVDTSGSSVASSTSTQRFALRPKLRGFESSDDRASLGGGTPTGMGGAGGMQGARAGVASSGAGTGGGAGSTGGEGIAKGSRSRVQAGAVIGSSAVVKTAAKPLAPGSKGIAAARAPVVSAPAGMGVRTQAADGLQAGGSESPLGGKGKGKGKSKGKGKGKGKAIREGKGADGGKTPTETGPKTTKKQPMPKETGPKTTKKQPMPKETGPKTTKKQPMPKETGPQTTKKQPMPKETGPKTTKKQPMPKEKQPAPGAAGLASGESKGVGTSLQTKPKLKPKLKAAAGAGTPKPAAGDRQPPPPPPAGAGGAGSGVSSGQSQKPAAPRGLAGSAAAAPAPASGSQSGRVVIVSSSKPKAPRPGK